MEIRNAKFVKGIIGTTDIIQEDKPTFAFIGRSNVGKSSVINSLVNRKDLVRSSSTPGRTQQINYFLINESLYFADLPGYGYAKMPAKQHVKLQKQLAWFLGSDEVKLEAVILIIDVNVGLKENDLEVLDTLRELGRKVIIVANKTDKSGKNEVRKQVELIQSVIGECDVIPYSVKTGQGRVELLDKISSVVFDTKQVSDII